MGGNCVKKDHLGGNYSPRYFAEHFVLPWGRNMVESCGDLDNQIIPYLQKELSRVMELNRKPKGPGPVKKIQALGNLRSQGFAKCVARKCPNKNVLDIVNVGAFGICLNVVNLSILDVLGQRMKRRRILLKEPRVIFAQNVCLRIRLLWCVKIMFPRQRTQSQL